jgi:hypothetical protein
MFWSESKVIHAPQNCESIHAYMSALFVQNYPEWFGVCDGVVHVLGMLSWFLFVPNMDSYSFSTKYLQYISRLYIYYTYVYIYYTYIYIPLVDFMPIKSLSIDGYISSIPIQPTNHQ